MIMNMKESSCVSWSVITSNNIHVHCYTFVPFYIKGTWKCANMSKCPLYTGYIYMYYSLMEAIPFIDSDHIEVPFIYRLHLYVLFINGGNALHRQWLYRLEVAFNAGLTIYRQWLYRGGL
jgi:hypothetical protein